MSLNLYSSMIVLCPECIGSLVCEVFVLCILNNVCCLLYLCPFFSFQAFVYRLKFLFSVSSLSLHQVLGCYCIPLNICKICSVPLSAQSSMVRSSNILQLLWYQAGGLAGHGTVSAHLFFFCSFRGQALPPFLAPATTIRSFVSQPRPQDVEHADQSLQGEVTQSSGRGASSCKNPSLVND